jgi:callose synthase
MNLRQRINRPGAGAGAGAPQTSEGGVYNIIPLNNLLVQHPSQASIEVRAAINSLADVEGLPANRYAPWQPNIDLLDWLGCFFGFQTDNVRNQREHLVMLLANYQMRLSTTPERIDMIHATVSRKLCKKLLKNYNSWIKYLGRRSSVHLSERDHRRYLLYPALYLLIWGEAANLRFVPEALCYIFHHMAIELTKILDGTLELTAGPVTMGENGYLTKVVTPLYNTISEEVKASRDGKAPHSAWRNYDDFNEYFWSRRVFDRLKWPLHLSSGFFAKPKSAHGVGKTGFVEQRSFWNIYRSFDRLWVMLILYFQAALIVAWQGHTWPWENLRDRDNQVKVLTIFITWAALRLLQAVLDAGTQYSLVSRENSLLCLRMVLKIVVAAGWTIAFSVLYVRMWDQHDRDRHWSVAAEQRILNFLEAAGVFVIPEAVAVLLFVIPWLRNMLEKANWRILYVLTWWFQHRTFVGRGVREGLIDNIKYSFFWVVLLLAKFSFSYVLQIRPMVSPTKAIYKIGRVEYHWHEFFTHTNRFAVVILWVPVVLVYLMDIQIWYFSFMYMRGDSIFSCRQWNLHQIINVFWSKTSRNKPCAGLLLVFETLVGC